MPKKGILLHPAASESLTWDARNSKGKDFRHEPAQAYQIHAGQIQYFKTLGYAVIRKCLLRNVAFPLRNDEPHLVPQPGKSLAHFHDLNPMRFLGWDPGICNIKNLHFFQLGGKFLLISMLSKSRLRLAPACLAQAAMRFMPSSMDTVVW